MASDDRGSLQLYDGEPLPLNQVATLSGHDADQPWSEVFFGPITGEKLRYSTEIERVDGTEVPSGYSSVRLLPGPYTLRVHAWSINSRHPNDPDYPRSGSGDYLCTVPGPGNYEVRTQFLMRQRMKCTLYDTARDEIVHRAEFDLVWD